MIPKQARLTRQPRMPHTEVSEMGVTIKHASTCPKLLEQDTFPKVAPQLVEVVKSATIDWTTGTIIAKAAPLSTLKAIIKVKWEVKASRKVQIPHKPAPTCSSHFREAPLSTKFPHKGPVTAVATP